MLSDLIKLYRKNSISNLVLEKELIREIGGIIPSDVEIVENESSNFIATVIPSQSNKIVSVKYIVDRNTVFNDTLTPEEFTKVFYSQIRCSQKAISTYLKFMTLHKDIEIPYSNAIALYLSIYKISIEAIPEDIKAKLQNINSKLIPCTHKIDELIEALEIPTKDTAAAIEAAVINGLLPKKMAQAAKALSERTKYNDTSAVDPEVNTINKNFEDIRSYASNTNGIDVDHRSINIPYDYVPSTNQ